MAGAPAGGAELFFERLAIAMHAAGDAVLPVIRNDPARHARLAAAGLSPATLRFGGVFDLATRPGLRRMLRAFAPGVAVAWMGRAARFAPRGDWVLMGRLGGYYDLSRFRRCDHLIGNTQTLTRWIAGQGWPAARVHHLPNFAPDLHGHPPQRFGVPDDVPLIAASGRLHRNKAFDVLIRAMAAIPRAHLVIAGEGPERAALEELARREGVAARVHLPGWLADTAGLLAACDMFVCPSRHEPLGNVVLEAWSAERAVVAAVADGPRELIAPNETGMLVPIEDAAALAGSIGLLLEQPALAARLGAAGRVRWQADFAPDAVLARWRDLLGRVEKN